MKLKERTITLTTSDPMVDDSRERDAATSAQIAGLLGPTLVVLTSSEAMNLQIWKTNIAPVTYLNGLFLFVSGLAIVRAHNRWTRAWPVIVTLLGWGVLAGGTFRMFAPEARQASDGPPTYGVLAAGFVVGLFLTLKAYWPSKR